MTIYTTSSSTSVTISALTANDLWIIRPSVFVTVSGADAIDATGTATNRAFYIHGSVVSDSADGIDLGDDTTSSGGANRVFIAATGSIMAGDCAVESAGGSLDLTNEGSLFSKTYAIKADGNGNKLVNLGSVTSTQLSAIIAQGGGNLISNDGSITAGGKGIHVESGDNVVLNRGLITAEDDGISAYGLNNWLTNSGEINARDVGMLAQGDDAYVDNTGLIKAATGVQIDGVGIDFSNRGSISATSVGVVGDGDGARYTNSGEISGDMGFYLLGDGDTLTNSGQINANQYGLYFDGAGALLTNSGLIASKSTILQQPAVYMSTQAGEANKLVNLGVLSGLNSAIYTTSGNETVVNRGTVSGHVVLGSGNDTFDGRGGDVDGEVRGGAGDDIYWLDDPDLVIVEQASEGTDTVRAKCSFELASNLETLILIGQGGFAGVGNSLANTLYGNNDANNLHGLAGNDSLRGKAGDDSLDGGAGDDTLVGGLGADVLNGGAGNDWALFSDVTEGVVVDLQTPANNTGVAAGDTLISIEVLAGSAYADTLSGNASANTLRGSHGNDLLQGRGGADTLVGGGGQDTLSGGAGADVFDFDFISETDDSAPDLISDFAPSGDDIDLSSIDADKVTAGDQAFAFIGSAAFSAAGQLRCYASAGTTYVEGNIDTTFGADFIIQLTGNLTLTEANFIL